MAFTTAQERKIRYYLGWGSRYQSTDSALEHAIENLNTSGDSDSISFIASTLLVDLDAAYDGLKDAWTRLKAAQVGEIRTALEKEIGLRRDEGKRLAESLGSYMNVPVKHNVFGSGANRNFVEFGRGHSALFGGYFKHG